MIGGLRLIDGVIIAAIALLALKALGFFSAPRRIDPAAAAASAVAQHQELPKFARVLAHARTNYVPADVNITGAVAEKEKDKGEPASKDSPPAKPAPVEPSPQPA